jgi:hypothetical protein
MFMVKSLSRTSDLVEASRNAIPFTLSSIHLYIESKSPPNPPPSLQSVGSLPSLTVDRPDRRTWAAGVGLSKRLKKYGGNSELGIRPWRI